MSDFNKALLYVLQNEVPCDHNGEPIPSRAFENNPKDPGGMTTWGIIATEYAAWTRAPATEAVMRTMTVAQAAAVYRAKYWNLMRCDSITNQGVATAMMDSAVNPGQGFATHTVQRIARVAQDGQIGPITIAAINAMDHKAFLVSLNKSCLSYYYGVVANNHSLDVFEAGWTNRANRLLTLVNA